MQNWALSIALDNPADAKVVETTPLTLADGQIRVTIERFALTANNVTYATFGRAMRYWDFFPGDDGRGRLPVWGTAIVSESRCPAVPEGSRWYGYLPAAAELVLTPAQVRSQGFVDASEHRSSLPQVYNRYAAVADRDEHSEQMQMVLQPLFITAFLLDQVLAEPDRAWAGAQVISTSASSKTAIAMAHCLARRDNVAHVGLTSGGNVAFVERLGLYDRVVSYEDLASLNAHTSAVIVDFAGDADLNRRLHTQLAGVLRANIRVGGAHWTQSAPPHDLPPPKPEFFFAPDHVVRLSKDWGREAFETRYAAAWLAFAADAERYFTVEEVAGAAAALRIYTALIGGQFSPAASMTVRSQTQ